MSKQEIWTILELINSSENYLKPKGVSNARREIEEMLCSILKCSRLELYLKFEMPLTENELVIFRELIKRKAKREPLQYILGETDFFNVKIKVNPSVLIPRHETEILVEKVIKKAKQIQKTQLKILDVGTGSGCIAIALAKELKNAQVLGIDVSEKAIFTANENAKLNEVQNVRFILKNALETPQKTGIFDFIVSNPPYVTTDDCEKLMPEVRDFEPILALDGGEKGLDFYEGLTPVCKLLLLENGFLFYEVGFKQAKDVEKILEKNGFSEIQIFPDYNKIERIVCGKKVSSLFN
ncbi:peptide chain release factor N(5)-glutamine methyltransferase [bacterium]|nr:peptide chain release factor N(5)-glutamine methyltransferase [bacterium]